MQCSLLYRFRVVDRLPEPPSTAAVKGTLVHAVLEHLYDVPQGERTLEVATRMLPERWTMLREADPQLESMFSTREEVDTWLAQAEALLGTYFTLEDPNRLAPAERELRLEARLAGGPLLRGVVDRLDVSPGGLVRVVDYKTGKSPRRGYEGTAFFQMRFYAFLLWLARGELPAMLQLVYLGDAQVVRHEPTAAEMTTLEARVRSLWSSIERAAAEDRWEPRRSALCGWCSFQALCPAFGGTPPPVPEGAVERAVGISPTG